MRSAPNGANLIITSLGRDLRENIRDKHKIKRVDYLTGNARLYQERIAIYRTLTQLALLNVKTPVVVIDWCPLCGDLSHRSMDLFFASDRRCVSLQRSAILCLIAAFVT